MKFTESGHVIVSVSDSSAGNVRFAVKDTGSGISAETKSRLFDSFTQGDASTTRRFGCTGLGLAICKKLVELMGGDIGVDSVEGQGSTFWFELPLKVASESILVVKDADEALPLLDKQVLVVDDNAIGRDILRSMLQSLGAQVTQASNAGEARRMVKDDLPDLMIVDYHMPKIDGLNLATSLRADERTVSVKILMLSSSDVPREAQRFVRLDGFGTKPVMKRGLLRLCKEALSVSGPEVTENRASVRLSEEEPYPSQKLVRVLLAEDNVVNQKVAVRMLEKLGCRVDVAAHGKEAVELWTQFPYAMIFMDCQMPEIDSLTATRMIRERELAGDHIPIVAMTANAMEKDRDDCLHAGMDDYASKPVKIDILGELVKRYSTRSGQATATSANLQP